MGELFNPAVRSSNWVPKSLSVPVLKSSNLYSLGARRATLGDLEQIRTKYNIPFSVQLRVSRVDERPGRPLSDGTLDFAYPSNLFT